MVKLKSLTKLANGGRRNSGRIAIQNLLCTEFLDSFCIFVARVLGLCIQAADMSVH